MKQTQKMIRIGFDLDGVLLDNPSRVFRSLISRSKKAHLFPRKELEFYHPNSAWEKFLWTMVHKSSFKLAKGFTQLESLALEQTNLQIYVISARFACLKKDTCQWQKIINQKHIFQGMYFNDQDEQPHLFKKRMVQELALDYFVEDNWDVVNYLAKEQGQTQIWWLSNFLDRQIDYPHKFFSFQSVVSKIAGFLL